MALRLSFKAVQCAARHMVRAYLWHALLSTLGCTPCDVCVRACVCTVRACSTCARNPARAGSRPLIAWRTPQWVLALPTPTRRGACTTFCDCTAFRTGRWGNIQKGCTALFAALLIGVCVLIAKLQVQHARPAAATLTPRQIPTRVSLPPPFALLTVCTPDQGKLPSPSTLLTAYTPNQGTLPALHTWQHRTCQHTWPPHLPHMHRRVRWRVQATL